MNNLHGNKQNWCIINIILHIRVRNTRVDHRISICQVLMGVQKPSNFGGFDTKRNLFRIKTTKTEKADHPFGR